MQNKATLTRRDVLKRTATALATAPYVIPATALGAEGKPAASERITMALIGCGGRGTSVMEGLVANGAQVVASCDVYRERREAVARKYQGKPYADFRELLARDGIDAVLNATPEHWHAVVSIEACRQGKDVYCEKPLAFTIEEAQAVVAAARRYDRVFQTGTQQRSDGSFRFACELVHNGYIGEVKSVHTTPGGTSRHCSLPAQPVPPGLDWDMWLGPAPWAPYHHDRCVDLWHWWNWRDYSGGLMTDRGAHDFDIVQWGLNADGSGPVEITPPEGGGKNDLIYKYANGALLYSGQGGWGSNGKPGAWVGFKGTKGEVEVWRGGIKTDPANLAEVKIGPDEIHLYESHNHQGNFLECVRSRKRAAADVAIGASSVTVCHLGNIAYWLGRPLKWDPVKQEFPGDEEANRLRRRSMREPWRLC
ncbi:MAG: Gfo/Idh/MocA family oxidoreductase [Pirellulales bacterium]|nr:Gfo/Idh/MocA family oxidoreductase [Pirellulales bacterium]